MQAQAKTGSGKTLAFLVPAVELVLQQVTLFHLSLSSSLPFPLFSSPPLLSLLLSSSLLILFKQPKSSDTVVVILAPVRELCLQISQVASQLIGKHPFYFLSPSLILLLCSPSSPLLSLYLFLIARSRPIGVLLILGGKKRQSAQALNAMRKDIIVATPGRFAEHVSSGDILLLSRSPSPSPSPPLLAIFRN